MTVIHLEDNFVMMHFSQHVIGKIGVAGVALKSAPNHDTKI